MPSSKRKPRRKETAHDSDLDLPESSPTRPAAKKRKISVSHASPTLRTTSPERISVEGVEDSPDDSEDVSNSELIESVISYLQVAKEAVMATTEHANEKNQPENSDKVSAYAKIAGREWTYFVIEQVVNIGRPPDIKDGLNASASSPIADMKEMLPVHIDLGPSKIVSRHHASVFYDSEYPEGGGWHVRVNGRNGVRANGHLLKRGASQQLRSGDILEIAGTQMMFVTPGDKAVIDPIFVERAKQLASGEDWTGPHAHPDSAPGESLPTGSSFSGNHVSLAPAPAFYKRAVTPPASQKDGRHQRGVFDSRPPPSPIYNRGMMMESTQEIDYSKDSAKDLKPPFSYATMIAQAIFSSDEEKLTLSNIYAWISDRYAFYRHSNSGWQNSIRHNLSLNKAFQKVPRRTDEPGKGMKWMICPEFRQEYWKKQARRGPSSSSAPTSPAAGANPKFIGSNGQNLGYDQSMVSQFPLMAPASKTGDHYSMFNAPEHLTPDRQSMNRRRHDTGTTAPDPDLDESPVPRRHSHSHPSVEAQTYVLSQPTPHLPQQSPANPTLSSSYLDTPFHSSHSVITPAPLRRNPILAPPSTLVAPSKYMPESSPAGPAGLGFWKGLMNMGTTPGHALPDMSPVKGEPGDGETMGREVMSSSPPPMSPSKPARRSPTTHAKREETAHQGKFSGGGGGAAAAAARRGGGVGGGGGGDAAAADDDEEGGAVVGGGFDLAKGFQPIGGFHHGGRVRNTGGATAARASP